MRAIVPVFVCAVAAANPLAPDVNVVVGDLAIKNATISIPDLRSAIDAVRIRTSRFRTCYLDALAKTPKLAGSLSFALRIRRDGSVKATPAKGMPPQADDLGKCVAAALSELRFAIKADADATLTIQFSPAQPPPAVSGLPLTMKLELLGKDPANGLMPDDISAPFEASLGKLSACYTAARTRHPALAAVTATFQLEIDAKGRVVRASGAATEPVAREIETCGLPTVRALKFPAKGGARVTFPIRFK